jgi:hypothetical protein
LIGESELKALFDEIKKIEFSASMHVDPLLVSLYPNKQMDNMINLSSSAFKGDKRIAKLISGGTLDFYDGDSPAYILSIRHNNTDAKIIDSLLNNIRNSYPKKFTIFPSKISIGAYWVTDNVSDSFATEILKRVITNFVVDLAKIDSEGYDFFGYDKDSYDRGGFDRRGIHKETLTKYGPDGFSREGFDTHGLERWGFDRRGFDRRGINCKTGTAYDVDGLDREGFGTDGYNRSGYDRDGFDRKGFDVRGYDRKGFNKRGFDKNGKHKNMVIQLFKEIYDFVA